MTIWKPITRFFASKRLVGDGHFDRSGFLDVAQALLPVAGFTAQVGGAVLI
jgi:hypothetical protein